jgi:ATP-dependent HslUV protease subunit HslV
MSVITVVRKGPTCAIAADSLSSYGSTLQPREFQRNESKILRYEENCFGLVGYAAHSLVLQSLIERHPGKFDLRGKSRIFETLLGLHDLLKDRYHLQTGDDLSDQPYESSQMTFFIANSAGIYLVDTYREITEIDRFWAIGSGRTFALGAMDAVFEDPERDAESVARLGVSVACKFNTYCSEPIDSFAIALDNEGNENVTKKKSGRKIARP